MAQPLVLIYNLEAPVEARLTALCERQGITVRRVNPWEYGMPIGALAGIPVGRSAAPAMGAGFSVPLLVMCPLLCPPLDAFCRACAARGRPRVALKAVLTPHHVTWSSVHLRGGLMRKPQAFHHRV